MAIDPRPYARREYVNLQNRIEAKGTSLPVKLDACSELLEDAGDTEVTTFTQFLLFSGQTPSGGTGGTAGGGKPGARTPSGGFARLPPWYRAATDVTAAKAAAARISAAASRLPQVAPQIGPDPSPIATTTTGATHAGPAGTPGLRPQPATVDVTLTQKPEVQVIRSGGKSFLVQTSEVSDVAGLRDFAPIVESVADLFGFAGFTGNVDAGFDAAAALWAVGVVYEQTWESLGYRRGRLVRSLPLTPGEQVEIQLKSWDRNTVKKALVESIENNLSSEVTGEEKWTLASKMTAAEQTNAGVNPSAGARAGVTVPLQYVTGELGGNLGLSGTLSDALSSGMESGSDFVQSVVRKAAFSLKSTRTNSVEMTSEVGTETTTKQTIANTNRCHSVTYHYFEVLEDFRVSTRVSQADLYLLIPLPLPDITLEWVLCNECLLHKVLLCADYYAGFTGAKQLRMQQLMAPALAALTALLGGSGTKDPAQSQAETNYDSDVAAVFAAYHQLRDASLLARGKSDSGSDSGFVNAITGMRNGWNQFAGDLRTGGAQTAQAVEGGVTTVIQTTQTAMSDVKNTVDDFVPPPKSLPFAFHPFGSPGSDAASGAQEMSGGPGSWVWWKVAHVTAPNIESSLAHLETAWNTLQSQTSPQATLLAQQAALDQFFGEIAPLDTNFDKVKAGIGVLTSALIAAGASAGGFGGGLASTAVGLPGAGGVPGSLLGAATVAAILAFAASLEAAGLVDTVPDDAGLESAIKALYSRWQALRTLGPLAGLGAAGAAGASGTDLAAQIQSFLDDQRALAEAQVEYDRLVCHLHDNLLFYMQAIWAQWPDYQVAAIAEAFGVPSGVFEPSFRGFVGDRGAVRITDTGWLASQGLDWESQIQKAFASSATETPPELFTLPTRGMVVECALGQCDGCEDFIQQHRALDLEARRAEVALANAKAEQENQEVLRLKARIAANKLGDPTPFEGGDVTVKVKADPTD